MNLFRLLLDLDSSHAPFRVQKFILFLPCEIDAVEAIPTKADVEDGEHLKHVQTTLEEVSTDAKLVMPQSSVFQNFRSCHVRGEVQVNPERQTEHDFTHPVVEPGGVHDLAVEY